jgi:hypothetical protein
MPARSALAQNRSRLLSIRRDALQKGLPAGGKSGGPSDVWLFPIAMRALQRTRRTYFKILPQSSYLTGI